MVHRTLQIFGFPVNFPVTREFAAHKIGDIGGTVTCKSQRFGAARGQTEAPSIPPRSAGRVAAKRPGGEDTGEVERPPPGAQERATLPAERGGIKPLARGIGE